MTCCMQNMGKNVLLDVHRLQPKLTELLILADFGYPDKTFGLFAPKNVFLNCLALQSFDLERTC